MWSRPRFILVDADELYQAVLVLRMTVFSVRKSGV